MRFMIERYTGEDEHYVAIGAVEAHGKVDALKVAAAEGLAEVSDKHRAAPVGVSALRQRRMAVLREGRSWLADEHAACGVVAATVRIVADTGAIDVLVSRNGKRAFMVPRGSLFDLQTAGRTEE